MGPQGSQPRGGRSYLAQRQVWFFSLMPQAEFDQEGMAHTTQNQMALDRNKLAYFKVIHARMALPSISPSLRWDYVLSSFFRN